MKTMNLTQREARDGLLYAAVPLLGFAVFFFVPFLISFVRSFQTGISSEFAGLDNYISVFQSNSFRLAAGNTFRFMLVGVPAIILFSLAVALALDAGLRSSSLFRTVFLMPYVIPVASSVMVFQILFEQSGIVNTLLPPAERVNFLHSGSAFAILVLLYIWKNFGYNMILFASGLSQIPHEYYEAAKVDGANGFRIFWHITLPLLTPTFFFVFIISIVNSFKVYREAYALSGAYPDSSIYMLQHFMNNNFVNLNYQRLSVASNYVFLIIFLLVFLLYRFQKRTGDNQL